MKDLVDLSFVESSKFFYSHGLEEIYQLEKVDPRTIRPFCCTNKTPSLTDSEHSVSIFSDLFLFSDPASLEAMPSLHLMEPVDVFHLPPSLVQRLEGEGIKTLGDLRPFLFTKEKDLPHWIRTQIKEIRSFVTHSDFNQPAKYSTQIQWKSLRNILFYSIDCQKASALFHAFHIPLAPRMQEKRLRHQQQRGNLTSIEQGCIIEEWRCKDVLPVIKKALHDMGEAFLIRWVQRRMGFASIKELTQRIFMLSDDPILATSLLPLLSEICTWRDWPWETLFFEAVPGVFCVDEACAHTLQRVFSIMQSFFYKTNTRYPLDDITRWVLQEAVAQWLDVSSGKIQKLFLSSPFFYVTIAADGSLWMNQSQ